MYENEVLIFEPINSIGKTNPEALFTNRILKEEELENWFDFVHSVFKEKTSRQYFVNHHSNDPFSNADDIMVAINHKDEIVGTVKIFHRLIQINNGKMIGKCKCKGIGEVSTRSDYRSKGIAGSLLQMQLERIRNKFDDELILSSLHASTDASKLYGKLGWKAVPLHYSKLSFSVHNEGMYNSNQSVRVESTNFKTNEIRELYDNYCKKYKFCGTEIRAEDYWNNWISYESTTQECRSYSLYENNVLKSYIIIGLGTTENFKVKEFVCLTSDYPNRNFEYFFVLLIHTLKEFNVQEQSHISVTLPRPVAKFVFSLSNTDISQPTLTYLNHKGILKEYQEFWWTDCGYMYNIVKKPYPNFALCDVIEDERHLVWKTDGF